MEDLDALIAPQDPTGKIEAVEETQASLLPQDPSAVLSERDT